MGITNHAAKVAILGDYPPRKCGIATFTRDLRDAVAGLKPDWQAPVVTVTDRGNHYEYPPEVRFEINEQEVPSYLRAAEFLNLSHADLLCVQHEFGIFGGPAGSHILALLRRAKMPSVVTLHTVLANPDEEQRQAFGELIDCASKLVVMTARGASMLREIYGVRDSKISIIPHGIPDIPFVDPNFYKDQFGVAGRSVLLTFGLLSPGKGIEYAIQAMPAIVRQNPGCVYIVLGATHPNLSGAVGEGIGRRAECQICKPLCGSSGVVRIHRSCGYLCDPISQRGPDYLWDAGILLRCGKGGGFNALLARDRIAGQ